MADRKYLVVGGILLAGSAIGIGFWLYEKYMQPEAYIKDARIQRQGNTLVVTAQVQNTGKRKGYFKIQALLASKQCPTGTTGTLPKDSQVWWNIDKCINTNPGPMGAWLGQGAGLGWVEIAPGSSTALTATTTTSVPTGDYNLYVNAAVSLYPDGHKRLFDREYYLWVPNVHV